MISLDARTILDLPTDELALEVLADFVTTREWSEHNYLSQSLGKQPQEVLRAISEAFGWLRARCLIAQEPAELNTYAVFVTRAGHNALSQGLDGVRARQRLQEGLHPDIERVARRQFLLGEYEQAVFVAMKAVEVRVRRLGRLGPDLVGCDLMNAAFKNKPPVLGPLTDPDAVGGERDGMRSLFVGAYAVLRNPAGHREVDYDDLAEAAEAVATASLLMRILDRTERRLTAAS